MKMYKAFESVEVDTELANEKYSIMEGAIKIYTKLKRKGKTHRSVADKNVADVNEIANSIPLNVNRLTQSDENHTGPIGNGLVKSELIGVLLEKMTIL